MGQVIAIGGKRDNNSPALALDLKKINISNIAMLMMMKRMNMMMAMMMMNINIVIIAMPCFEDHLTAPGSIITWLKAGNL